MSRNVVRKSLPCQAVKDEVVPQGEVFGRGWIDRHARLPRMPELALADTLVRDLLERLRLVLRERSHEDR